MALWAGVVALLLGVLAALTRQFDFMFVLRNLVELGAVVGVFALVCAAEARN
jgi:hypothetical protein